MLWSNREFLIGHNRWMIQLIEAFKYDQKKLKQVMDLINLDNDIPKKVDCKYLLCSRSCQKRLGIEQLISLLNLCGSQSNFRKQIITRLGNFSTTLLALFLPLLITQLSKANSDLQQFLTNISLRDQNFLYQYYWSLRLGFVSTSYQHLQQLIIALDKKKPNLGKKLQQGYMVLYLLMDSCTNKPNRDRDNNSSSRNKNNLYSPSNTYRETIFKKLLEQHEIILSSVPIATKPETTFGSIYLDRIVYKNSASRPFIIPIHTLEGEYYNLLLKKDDLRIDSLIIKCIKIAEHYLQTELGDNFELVTYNVLPINHLYGFIEIVPGAKTLYEITKEHDLLHYIMDQNSQDTILTIKNRFLKSTAVYCVLTYLFGIGDRHLNNIMITPQGRLFHIDYNFILGRDPKPLAPHLRITKEMIDFLGGKNSQFYSQFQHYCFQIFLTLKRHASVFLQILSTMCDAQPPFPHQITFDILKNEIINRFLPGLSETEAREYFQQTIEHSQSYNNLFYQWLYHPEKPKIF